MELKIREKAQDTYLQKKKSIEYKSVNHSKNTSKNLVR